MLNLIKTIRTTSFQSPKFQFIYGGNRWFTLKTETNNKVGIFSSTFTDPYINLGVEEWLLMNNKEMDHALYLYCNAPAVVIGRSQNPWKEVNLEALYQEKIALVRRKSGGGTVYHDLGNSNYFVLMPRDKFERTTNAEMVRSALEDLGIPASLTERKDIAVNGDKVSGSAYKLSGNKAFHHGTMLLSTDLKRLSKVLKIQDVEVISKGVESVRSPVTNLKNYLPDISHRIFCDAVLPRFLSTYNYPTVEPTLIDSNFLIKHPEILGYADKLKDWDWAYGQTPGFKIKFKMSLYGMSLNSTQLGGELTSKNGLINSLNLETLPWITSKEEALKASQDLSQSLTSYFSGHKFQRHTIQSFLICGPPDFLTSIPNYDIIWTSLLNRLLELSSE